MKNINADTLDPEYVYYSFRDIIIKGNTIQIYHQENNVRCLKWSCQISQTDKLSKKIKNILVQRVFSDILISVPVYGGIYLVMAFFSASFDSKMVAASLVTAALFSTLFNTFKKHSKNEHHLIIHTSGIKRSIYHSNEREEIEVIIDTFTDIKKGKLAVFK
ncbi:MAG: hypothetical protein HRT73_12155 [Flavobacteriales bacterium]|nr:hypothetical protein [Flavobacteriales bacterium]